MFPVADVGYCPVKLGMMSNRLQSGVNTLQGFREDKRNRVSLGTVPFLVHQPLIQPPAALPWADVSLYSVLHQLWAVHLIWAHLRLQLCQPRQGGLWPHPVVLRRGVQSAGLRQVCVSVTTNVQQTSHQAFLTAVQMFLSPRASCLGEVAPILTCITPGTLQLLSVAWNYPLALWSICLSAQLESAEFGSWSESDFLFFFHLLFMLLGFSVCLWQLFQQPVGVPGQVRRVRVQTGRQSPGCNDERRAFQIPEGDGASKCNILSISSCLL